jgi:galactokinase
MTSAGYRQSADALSTSSMRRILIAVAAPSGQFVVVFRWRPLPHCGHSRGCNGEQKSQLPDRLLRRVRNVVTENRRVLDAVSARRQNDLSRFGKRLTESRKLARRLPSKRSELDTFVGVAQEPLVSSAPD